MRTRQLQSQWTGLPLEHKCPLWSAEGWLLRLGIWRGLEKGTERELRRVCLQLFENEIDHVIEAPGLGKLHDGRD